jgi:hypothetical protein
VWLIALAIILVCVRLETHFYLSEMCPLEVIFEIESPIADMNMDYFADYWKWKYKTSCD